MSEFISLAEAVEMTRTYRAQSNDILKSEFQNRDILCLSETIDKSSVMDLLQQHGCEKLRIYYGMTDNLQVHAVLVGVNDHDEDILPVGDELVLDKGSRCPDVCPPASPLNS